MIRQIEKPGVMGEFLWIDALSAMVQWGQVIQYRRARRADDDV
jgi:hypothetical protein